MCKLLVALTRYLSLYAVLLAISAVVAKSFGGRLIGKNHKSTIPRGTGGSGALPHVLNFIRGYVTNPGYI